MLASLRRRPHPAALLFLLATSLFAQTTPPQTTPPQTTPSAPPDLTGLRAQLTALRDTFVREAAGAGLSCSIPPPTLVLHHIPSFGNYDQDTNTLITPDWSQLTPDEAGLFARIAGPGATPEAVRREFETDVHRWVFVHELGHWTQHCRHLAAPPYATELDANRIAAAFWRLRDPALPPHMHAVFAGVVDHTPNPTPAGQSIEPYFNQNYEQLGPPPAYIWYQAHMCLTALDEAPAPTFIQLLQPKP